jgi:hypothetical protein
MSTLAAGFGILLGAVLIVATWLVADWVSYVIWHRRRYGYWSWSPW